MFALLPFYFYYYVFHLAPNAQIVDLLVISIYSYGVAVCFAFSSATKSELPQDSTYYGNHIQEFAKFCNKLDYVGILVLMWGAGIPTIYYGFFCNPGLQMLYWTSLYSAPSSLSVPAFGSPQFRHWRASFYAGFGLSSVVFIAHGLALHGWVLQKLRMSLAWMGWMATANLVGAVIYATRVPEKWLPYHFDIYGASHQIFHVAVIVAAYIHFWGLMESFLVIRSATHACSHA
ncbi:Adiponectin receptor protein-like protein [Hapsidospora chrysogenum ATCC 11550]|uniref:Adiponectin receptor protein-like protein n=1 Tax=Hapsidospora chrysogenum (strain ATCC 11550 / CBS 779.69 / DSM 880 / IAM 14645 / JCM 23072 / IMI 49137) TaxID=857340 RepID=A0A086T2M5_HAPC1|nr:Adiponectin receptor protein-like protein [Hapsidospora chrysogenum ATCC 11550]